ncbi:MAG TPA: carboxymuconolactone decarboxylase family protein [Thermoguttaceae bacterium]|nr:carboxymuconolactone decarboxylase family protein [Thermoguttaceae bacterium]
MEMRIKELIAIGASITANCQPCLEHHVDKARENGADQQEIKEAIAVGKAVRKGAAGKMDQHASTMLNEAAPSSGACGKADACRLA